MIRKTKTRTVLALSIATVVTAASQLLAGSGSKQAPRTGATAPAPASDTAWQLDLNTGFSLTRGNTDSLGLSVGLDAERHWDGWQVIGKAGYNYTELNNLVTGNALRLGLQLNRDITSRWYVGVANGFTYDEIARLDYRYQVALALGYRVWTEARSELAIEAGPGYSWEKQAGVSDDYATIRFAERFKYAISDDARFFQSLEYVPAIEDFGTYTLVAEAGITARICANLWWRTAVRDIYSSKAPVGLDKNDLQLTTGLSYGLGNPDAAASAPKKIRKKSDVTKPTAAPSRPEGVWQTTAAVGFSLAKGNADNSFLTGDIGTSMVSKPNEYLLSLGGAYGEVQKVRSVQNFHAGAQYNRLLTNQLYLGAGVTFLEDKIADLSYRVTPAVVLGYKLIDNDRTSLRVEAGPGYSWEKQGGIKDEYVTFVARERFEHAINDSAKLWQGETLQLDVNSTDKYTLLSEVGIDFWLTNNISVRTVAADLYDNKPAAGRKSNDFRLTSGIAISF